MRLFSNSKMAVVAFAICALITVDLSAQCASIGPMPPDLGAGDGYGNVALDGDVLVVGAFSDSDLAPNRGAAYVFRRDLTGQFQFEQKLIASDGQADDYFGWYVAVEGNLIVVANTPGLYFDGSAYVFRYDGATWNEEQRIVPDIDQPNDHFANSLAISGNRIAIGCPWHTGTVSEAGSIYTFVYDGAEWVQEAELFADDATASDHIGYSIVLEGDTLGSGAVSADVDGAADAGAFYVFERVGGVWTQVVKFVEPAPTAEQGFGYAAAMDGDTIVVGATPNTGEGTDLGNARVYRRVAGVWSFEQNLTPADQEPGDWFAAGLAISGDTILASSQLDDELFADMGSVYVYKRTGAVWTFSEKITVCGGVAEEYLGSSLAIDGDVGFASAYGSNAAGAYSGAVYTIVVAPSFVRGDVTVDGNINIADAISALGYLFSSANISCVLAADTNDDEAVNVADAIYLLSYLFSSGPALPAPNPSCGVDPTSGTLDCASFSICP